MRYGAAVDEIADLLADPPDDVTSRYLAAVCRAAGARSAHLARCRPGGAAVFLDGLALDDGPAAPPAGAGPWIESLSGDGIAVAAPGAVAPEGAVTAYISRGGGLVAVLVLGGEAEPDDAARSGLARLARFAPAVLREARGGAGAASAEATRLEEFGRASPDVFWVYDARSLVAEYVSPAFEAVHGRPAADVLAAPQFADADVVQEDRAAARASVERAAGGEIGIADFRIRRPGDGELRWLRTADFPLRGAGGDVERVGRIARDVTALRTVAEESRRLQQELQHRVRNALGVIRALVRRTAETSETLEDLASHLDGRINAFARVQSALARNPAAGLDLEQLLADEILTTSVEVKGKVTLKGPPVSLTPKAAETLGLILHELATNALEHGDLGTGQGRLRITWSVRPDRDVPRLVLEWAERGPVREPARPVHRGFGTELLEKTLPYELNGSATLHFERQGLRCVLEVPLSPLVLARSG